LVFELLSVYCEQGAGELSGETLVRDGTECWESRSDVWTWAPTWIADGGSLMDMDMWYMDVYSM